MNVGTMDLVLLFNPEDFQSINKTEFAIFLKYATVLRNKRPALRISIIRAQMIICFLLINYTAGFGQVTGKDSLKKDIAYFISTIGNDYAYWDKKKSDWQKVKEIYKTGIDSITTNRSLVQLLERFFYELYDHHASLNVNTRESQRMVPSGTDIWAAFINGKPVISEVRLDFGAHRSGLRAGMEILAFNDVPIQEAIKPFVPGSLTAPDPEAMDFALRVLLAGTHSGNRKITVVTKEGKKDFYPDEPVHHLKDRPFDGWIESRILSGNIGYMRINNRLWDNNLIPVFDSALREFKNTRSLVLDLRETPGGGNTTVARAILGSFISKPGFYQKHELTLEERLYGVKRSWVEIVSPRKEVYTKPLVVLVNHWTGSVGEGITIGFDALKRATIIGTEMAGLNGAVYSYRMPNSGIGFSFPVEKLYHVNGKPREKFTPHIKVDLIKSKGADPVLDTAISFLNKKNPKPN